MASEKPGSAVQPLFDLDFGAESGINESERILGRLCRRSFLRLWVQSNVYSDEGLRNGKGNSVELCDALLVFGDDVVIFSDKQATFQTGSDLKVAWGRWYRRCVQASIRQLHGAMQWLQRFPQRAFLDSRCTKPLPVRVPSSNAVRFHLVAVTRGSRDAARAAAGGKGRGSLGIDSSVTSADHADVPFTVGRSEPGKHFVHVFDEVSIALVLEELDTAVDFIEYLHKREALLGRPHSTVKAAGEEDLLATYLATMADDGLEHAFVVGPSDAPLPERIQVLPGNYDALVKGVPYRRKKVVDRDSYVWDALIDRFLKYGDHGVVPADLPVQGAVELERGIRLLAAESRFRRRLLAASLIDIGSKVGPGYGLTRLVGGSADETAYVLSIQPKQADESLADYRQFRVRKLFAQVCTAKLLAPECKTFVGIALDSPHKDYQGFAEDLVVFQQAHWSDQELADLERLRDELDLWAGHRVRRSRYRQDEFPAADQRDPFIPMPAATAPASRPMTSRPGHDPRVVKLGRAIERVRQKVQHASRRTKKSRKRKDQA